jgi:hypothetical protein
MMFIGAVYPKKIRELDLNSNLQRRGGKLLKAVQKRFYYLPQEAVEAHVFGLLEQIALVVLPASRQDLARFFGNNWAHLVQILHGKS